MCESGDFAGSGGAVSNRPIGSIDTSLRAADPAATCSSRSLRRYGAAARVRDTIQVPDRIPGAEFLITAGRCGAVHR
jgi:hypothetical protein